MEPRETDKSTSFLQASNGCGFLLPTQKGRAMSTASWLLTWNKSYKEKLISWSVHNNWATMFCNTKKLLILQLIGLGLLPSPIIHLKLKLTSHVQVQFWELWSRVLLSPIVSGVDLQFPSIQPGIPVSSKHRGINQHSHPTQTNFNTLSTNRAKLKCVSINREMRNHNHDQMLTKVSILSLSSSLEGRWSDVRASATPPLLITARQSPALDTTRLPFLINAVTQQEPPWRSPFKKSESVLR